ncbi:MAG: hypothetical protein LBE02_08250 [Spirochaetaceae bacterium]|nr:hypothetical protein [Spirochaetaceae bacterium]
MKKITAVLILAITAGVVFAQELKFDGYVNSGLGLVITNRKDNEGSVDPYITVYGVDAEQYGYRFRLNGSYTNADGNAGAKFRFQAQAKNRTDTTPGGGLPIMDIGVPIALGWVKFADMFTLNAGIIDDGTWASGGAILDDDMGEGLGLLLKASPVSGLDLGFGAYAVSALGGGDNNALAGGLNKNIIDWDYAKYVFNIGYTFPEVFKLTATFRNDNDAGGSTNRDETMKSIIGARLFMVKNLTAIAEVEVDELGEDFDTKGKINFYETLGYKLNSLNFGLNAVQYLSQADDSDIGLRFNPWVSYTIGKIVPRLDLVYFIGGKVDGSDNDEDGKYGRKNYAPVSGNNKDWSVIGARPSVKINFDSKTVLEIGDVINFETAANDYYGVAGDLSDSKITNVFYVDLKLSF